MNSKVISKIISGTILCSMICYTVPVFAYTKDETVYTKLNSKGNSYQTIVSTHITNSDNSKLINDMSDLLNIKNTNGDEEYLQDGKSLVWKAEESDIYYQGESSKELPVTCKITYELDGEEISAEDLAGKSGKVKISLEYTNNEERIVNVNGKKVKMYVPFVVVTGTIINNDTNKNIEVSNGKIVNDGTKSVVIGIALPGMQESLGISKSKLEIPSTIEITMDATEFEQNNILTYVTPKVLEDDDLDIFNKLDEIYSQVNALKSSSRKIEEGANTLKDGAQTYSEKSQEFNSAMNQVSEGISSVNSNYTKINTGINSLKQGTSSLTTGATQLDDGVNSLSSQLSSLPENVTALYNGSIALNAGVNGTENSIGLVSGVQLLEEKLQTAITTSTAAISSNNIAIDNEAKELTEELTEITSEIESLDNILKIENLSEEAKTTLNSTISELTDRKIDISSRITTLSTKKAINGKVIEGLTPTVEDNKKITDLNDGLKAVSDGAKNLSDGMTLLNTASQKLPTSITTLTKGTSSLVSGIKELSTGATSLTVGSAELKAGITKLDTSTKTLTSANDQLTEGATTLFEGARTLANGITTFNSDGIDKISNLVTGDVKGIATRVEKLTKLSKEYNNYTMLEGGNEGNTKFIMVIDAIKKQEETDSSKEQAIIENKDK